MSDAGWVALAPFVVLASLYAVYVVATRSTDIYRIAEGADGRTSTSKMQFLLWTAVVIPCYAAVFTANWRSGNVDASLGVPDNLMIALGLSVATTAGAKGLYLVGAAEKRKKGEDDKGGLLTDDGGHPELAKIQLMAWTLLAIAIFCVRIGVHVRTALNGSGATTTLPDIDTALLVLMGLGHAGYGSKKVLDRLAAKTPLLEPEGATEAQPAAEPAAKATAAVNQP